MLSPFDSPIGSLQKEVHKSKQSNFDNTGDNIILVVGFFLRNTITVDALKIAVV